MLRFLTLLLGLHLWVLLVLLPAELLGGWPAFDRSTSWGLSLRLALLLLPLPLLLLGGGWRQLRPGWLLGAFPASLLLPLLVMRPLAGERDLSWPLAGLLALSLLAFVAVAGRRAAERGLAGTLPLERDSAATGQSTAFGRAIWLRALSPLRLLVLASSLLLLLHASSFRSGLMEDLRRTVPQHLPEARVCLGLAAFLLWLLLLGGEHRVVAPGPSATATGHAPWRTAAELGRLLLLALAAAAGYMAIYSFSRLKVGSGLLAAVLALVLARLSRQAASRGGLAAEAAR